MIYLGLDYSCSHSRSHSSIERILSDVNRKISDVRVQLISLAKKLDDHINEVESNEYKKYLRIQDQRKTNPELMAMCDLLESQLNQKWIENYKTKALKILKISLIHNWKSLNPATVYEYKDSKLSLIVRSIQMLKVNIDDTSDEIYNKLEELVKEYGLMTALTGLNFYLNQENGSIISLMWRFNINPDRYKNPIHREMISRFNQYKNNSYNFKYSIKFEYDNLLKYDLHQRYFAFFYQLYKEIMLEYYISKTLDY